MALLGAVNYDPAAAVSKATSALLAMTAFDTANVRVTFTVPASGKVFARIGCAVRGGSATPFWPVVLLGILNGATVVQRQTPMAGVHGNVGAVGTAMKLEAAFSITGLTPGASISWDAAYAVEVLATGSGIRYGGPNTATTADDASGAITFEVWEA